jgi:hypothetical protein
VRRLGAPSAPRDGTIYKTFDDTAWIYHLGIKGTNGRYDKASVAIEFANELGLALDGDRLYAFGMSTPNTVYTGPFFAFDWRPQLLRAAGRGAGGRGDRADARYLPPSRYRALVLLPVDDVRLPAVFSGGDDRVPLELPQG